MAGAQKIHQALAPAFALGGNQYAVLGLLNMRFELNQRLFGIALAGKVGQSRCYEFSSFWRSLLQG